MVHEAEIRAREAEELKKKEELERKMRENEAQRQVRLSKL